MGKNLNLLYSLSNLHHFVEALVEYDRLDLDSWLAGSSGLVAVLLQKSSLIIILEEIPILKTNEVLRVVVGAHLQRPLVLDVLCRDAVGDALKHSSSASRNIFSLHWSSTQSRIVEHGGWIARLRSGAVV